MARILVCGGRDYNDRQRVRSALNAVVAKLRAKGLDVVALAEGGATGADALAAMWAHDIGLEPTSYPADWSKGRRAGPERNARMLDEFRPTHVVAFPGGRGTADMVRRARAAGVPVWEVKR